MRHRRRILVLLASLLLGISSHAWAFNPNYSGDTIQDDIAREFNGATSYTIPLTAPTQSVPTTPPANNCEATLQQEMGDGQIPTDEQCDCPVGATQPVCTALPASDCPNLLQIEENRLGNDAQYYDCTCPTGASTPQCTSYYTLCEAALPNYQNSTNECTCSQTATSAVPACTSDYSICESHAGRYENSNTTCTCSQTSTEPNCCTSTTVQDCTPTESCHEEITGYTCPDTNYSFPFSGIECVSDTGSYTSYEGATQTVSDSYCPSNASVVCLYNCGIGGFNCYAGILAPTKITAESCHNVTTCHPVTTQSCTTE